MLVDGTKRKWKRNREPSIAPLKVDFQWEEEIRARKAIQGQPLRKIPGRLSRRVKIAICLPASLSHHEKSSLGINTFRGRCTGMHDVACTWWVIDAKPQNVGELESDFIARKTETSLQWRQKEPRNASFIGISINFGFEGKFLILLCNRKYSRKPLWSL